MCSPSNGGGKRKLTGVSENRMGFAMLLAVPIAGCSSCTIKPRARVCTSSTASATVLIGAAGMSASPNLSSQAAAGFC